jgi:hypothetical protein
MICLWKAVKVIDGSMYTETVKWEVWNEVGTPSLAQRRSEG